MGYKLQKITLVIEKKMHKKYPEMNILRKVPN